MKLKCIELLSRIFLSLAMCILLTGCPEEQGEEPSDPFYIKNISQELVSVLITTIERDSGFDSLLTASDIDRIFSFAADSNNILNLQASELRAFKMLNKETLRLLPRGTFYFIINADSLNVYNSQSWDGESGVKRYFFYNLEDYQQINFTMEYP